MQTNSKTNIQMNMEPKEPAIVKGKKLNLKRETVRNLNDQLLTSQGHSLWTCDGSGVQPVDM
jgi:hypothetical protein